MRYISKIVKDRPLNLDFTTKFAILVASLGYLVDVYDLLIFNVVRKSSLLDIGIASENIVPVGIRLLNIQLTGMIIGGILWGILGDKVGRLQTLFGSIILYSIANILNAYVETIFQYEVCRFIAGIGLAGEIGAGITLVSELMPKEIRGIGTMIFAAVGVCGGILAGVVGEFLTWSQAYIFGGILGLLLLLLRVSVKESEIFNKHKSESDIKDRGKLISLFNSKNKFLKFISLIILASPIWILGGCLVGLCPQVSKSIGIVDEVKASYLTMIYSSGMFIGDLLSGYISQRLKSRKKVLYYFILSFFVFTVILLSGILPYKQAYYLLMFPIGINIGFWSMYVTFVAESYGTNIRATASTLIPNLGRATNIPITLGVSSLINFFPVNYAVIVVTVICVFFCIRALNYLDETFSADLEFKSS